MVVGDDGFVGLLARRNAPKGKALKLPLGEPQIEHANTMVGEGDISIEQIVPAPLTGYGGYGIGLTPYFDPTLRPVFDRGIVYALTNLRGAAPRSERIDELTDLYVFLFAQWAST